MCLPYPYAVVLQLGDGVALATDDGFNHLERHAIERGDKVDVPRLQQIDA